VVLREGILLVRVRGGEYEVEDKSIKMIPLRMSNAVPPFCDKIRETEYTGHLCC